MIGTAEDGEAIGNVGEATGVTPGSQETFDEFLRDYFASHQWGIGTGDAFRQLAERHCQCDLTALFQEWVYEK